LDCKYSAFRIISHRNTEILSRKEPIFKKALYMKQLNKAVAVVG